MFSDLERENMKVAFIEESHNSRTNNSTGPYFTSYIGKQGRTYFESSDPFSKRFRRRDFYAKYSSSRSSSNDEEKDIDSIKKKKSIIATNIDITLDGLPNARPESSFEPEERIKQMFIKELYSYSLI
ncbi:hypothetical protein DOY81_006971 [Sarcophaga bullata]|nr:hypothetical protein DOY81_006971 [Sarcophaga bullata]